MLSTVAKVHTGCSVQTGPLSAAGGFQAVTDACCARLTGVVQTSGSCRGSCLWQAVPLRLWELVRIPRPGGGGPQLAVGVLPHSAASTHMHISPKSLRPHTAEARRRLPSTAGLAATLHPDPLEMVPGAAPWRSLPPGTKLLICLNSGCIF